jgi:hypothetical protein
VHGSCQCGNEPSGSIKYWEVLVAAQLVASSTAQVQRVGPLCVAIELYVLFVLFKHTDFVHFS